MNIAVQDYSLSNRSDTSFSSHSVSSIPTKEKPEMSEKLVALETINKRISHLETALSDGSWEEKDVIEYGELTHKKFSVLSNTPIPNGIIEEKKTGENTLTPLFFDRLSLATALLLDDHPESLEELGLHGSSTFFFGSYVISNFLNSDEFQMCLSTLNGSLVPRVSAITKEFQSLIEKFKPFGSHVNTLTVVPQSSASKVKGIVQKVWDQEWQKNEELLFPLALRVPINQFEDICHLYLAHVEKPKVRFHVINTTPNDEQGYKRVSDDKFEQDCCITYKAEKVQVISRNLTDTLQFFTEPSKEGRHEKDSLEYFCEELSTKSYVMLGRDCKGLPPSENPLSKITLNFGYGCTISVFQGLLQNLLYQSQLPHCHQNELKSFIEIWKLGLKLYVLRNFQPAVMACGEREFDLVCKGIKDKLNSLNTAGPFVARLDMMFEWLSAIVEQYHSVDSTGV